MRYYFFPNTLPGILIGIVLLLPPKAYSQPYQFKKLNVESGISHSSVMQVLQDHKGLLWFATQFGLNRYDGYTFTKFLPEFGNESSLQSWQINCIYEDSKNRFWVGTHLKGLFLHDTLTDSFVMYELEGSQDTLYDAISLVEDFSGNLYVSVLGRGLHMVDTQTQKLKSLADTLAFPEVLKHASIEVLLEDPENRIWAGTKNHGVFMWNASRTAWKHLPLGDSMGLPGGTANVRSMFIDEQQKVWIGTEHGLVSISMAWDKLKHWEVPDNAEPILGDVYVRTIYKDRLGALWVGTENGLFILDEENESFTSFLHQPGNLHSISNNSIMDIGEDRSGVLWICNDNGGINYLENRGNTFQFLGTPPFTDSTYLDMHMVRNLVKTSSGNFLIGTTKNGLRYCDSIYQNYRELKAGDEGVPYNFANRIYSTWQDSADQLWVAADGGNIFRYRPESHDLIPYHYTLCSSHLLPKDQNISINYLKFFQDPSGRLWFTTLSDGQKPGGIYYYHPQKDSFFCWQTLFPAAKYLPVHDFYAMAIDSLSNFWLGTPEGLFQFEPNSGKYTRYSVTKGNSHGLSDDHIRKLFLDKQQKLWIGSLSSLISLDLRTKKWETHEDAEGWLVGGVMDIQEDNSGNLWMSTQQGIIRISPEGELTNFDQRDGLQRNEFTMNASSKDLVSHWIYFGSNEGFVGFHPDSMHLNEFIPPIIISQVTAMQEDKSDKLTKKVTQSLIYKKDISFSYQEDILIFQVAALNYLKGFKNQYQYRLLGFHDTWIPLGTENQFTLTDLEPGNYTLQVMGTNSDGKWNPKPTELALEIVPPWWNTKWAYTGYTLLFLGLLGYTLRSFKEKEIAKRLRREKEFELEKIQETDTLRSKFFTNISHEFRTPLTLIEGPAKKQLMYLEKAGSLQYTQEEGRKLFSGILHNSKLLLNLVGQLMDLSQLEAGVMQLKAAPLDIVELLKNYYAQFESLASQKHIHFSFHTPVDSLEVYLDKEKFDTVILNLLGNAFKFTPQEGKVEIRLDTSEDLIQLEISNTGKGIPRQEIPNVFNRFYQVQGTENKGEGIGIGLALVKELVELHKGKVEVQSYLEMHTTFTLTFPLGKEHLIPEEIVKETTSPIPPNFNNDNSTIVPEPIPPSSNGRKKATILVVEDHQGMQGFLHDILSPAYELVQAQDGQVGWQKVLQHVPDLVISDIMIPGLEGSELCERIKSDTRTSHIPVILLTARTDPASRVNGFQAGADDYVSKPFDPEEFQLRVHNHLEQVGRIQSYIHDRLFNHHTVPDPLGSLPLGSLNNTDKKFIEEALEWVYKNLDNSHFGVSELSDSLGLSRVHLFRKLKAIANVSPLEFIQNIRLNQAAKMLVETDTQISQIAYSVGFSSPGHFSDRFKKKFGQSPTEYRETHKNDP